MLISRGGARLLREVYHPLTGSALALRIYAFFSSDHALMGLALALRVRAVPAFELAISQAILHSKGRSN
jgi:hypothetical protein